MEAVLVVVLVVVEAGLGMVLSRRSMTLAVLVNFVKQSTLEGEMMKRAIMCPRNTHHNLPH